MSCHRLSTPVARAQQVVVYSFLTDAGLALAPPKTEKPARYALGNGGYQEWGGVRAGEKPTKLTAIEPLVRAALRLNRYEGLRVGETPDLVIEFHWGCMRPDVSGRGPINAIVNAIVNLPDMLDLVGGRSLESNPNRWLRQALIEAAMEERYFLILSAFEPFDYSRNRKTLLWRTQISIPIATLTQDQAFPILVGCGAPLFGRPTLEPKFISVDVERTLSAVEQKLSP